MTWSLGFGHPSRYEPRSTELNFGEQTGTGFFISKKPERAVFISKNTISLQCFFLSVSFVTMYVLFLLHYMFSSLFVLQSHAIIQFPYNVSAYQFLSLRYTYSFLFLLLYICCGFSCKKKKNLCILCFYSNFTDEK